MGILNMVYGSGGGGGSVFKPLCFTANTSGSTVSFQKKGSPGVIDLEISTDGNNWSSYEINTVITLSNIGDKVYFRNKSTTDVTYISSSSTTYYYFVMTGSINASGDVTSLLNKNGTITAINFCFQFLFLNCTSLITPPEIQIRNCASKCFSRMFQGCTNLIVLPRIHITNYSGSTRQNACEYMFNKCSKIKLSTSKTGDYQNEYRLPPSGTGTNGTNSFSNMFDNTGGTFTGTPTINTTYYTSNTIV